MTAPATGTVAAADARPALTLAGRSRARSQTWQFTYWAMLLLFTVLFLYPFVWLVSASLKPRAEVFDGRLIPLHPTLANFAEVWQVAPLLTWLGNSALVAVLAATSVTLSSSMVAFGFAYFRFPLRNLLFGLVLGSMMLPAMVTMIPVFLLWKNIGAIDTRLPLWGANLFGSPFYIFLLRQFFLGLPREQFEAARVDGCSNFGLYWRIAMPLARPALIVVFLFEVQASWDDLLRPLIYLQDEALYTVPLGLNSLFVRFNPIAGGEGDYQYIVTAALLATAPMIAVFAVCQRYFVQGISLHGAGR